MSNDKLLDKLAKMVAARDGEAAIGNEEAADAFASAISRMLLEHDLSMEEVTYRASVDSDPVIEVVSDLPKYGAEHKKARVGWQEALAATVADAHLCKFIIYRGSNRICFVGTKSHATVAEYAYGTLVAATEKMSWSAYNKMFYGLKGRGEDVSACRGFRAAWLTAFVSRIAARFAEVKRQAVANAAPGMGLMRISQSLAKADAFLKTKKLSRTRAASMGHGGNAEGARQGREAADKIELNRRGVGTTEMKRIHG